MYGNPETTPGGRALKYFSSVRIDMRRIETLKNGSEMIGNRTRAKVIKNKVAPPFKEAEFDIIYGEGISKVSEIIDLGVKLELIDKAGAWFTVNGERIQGKEAVKEYLTANPDVADRLEAEVRANAHKLMTPQARKAAVAAGRAIDISADDFEG
jgi:recombination protein RecA